MTVPHSLKGRLVAIAIEARLLAFGDDLEQQLGAAGVELDVAELVEAEQVEAAVAGDDAGQASFVGGFDEFVDELGGGGVADPAALFAGGDAEADEQVGLAGAGVAEQHDGFAGVEVGAGGEVARVAGLMVGDGVDVEVGEPFEAGEAGFVDAAGAAAFGCGRRPRRRGLRRGSRGRSAVPATAISASRSASVADGGQVQLAGGGADRRPARRRRRWSWSCWCAPGE